MKFFVSSTFKDLKGDRSIVIELLHGLTGMTKSNATGDVIAMEYFSASANDPREICIQKVVDSDVVIGLYGETYGSIDEESGVSMTELEFDTAIKHNIPILAFIKESTGREPLEKRFLDEKVKKGRMVSYYLTQEDLANKLNEALKYYFRGIEGFSYDSLWNVVKEMQLEFEKDPFQMKPYFPGEEANAFDDIFSSFESLNKIVSSLVEWYHSKLELFYQKENILALSDNELAKWVRSNEMVFSLPEIDWAFIALGIPNCENKIRLATMYLKLRYLQYRLLSEPWTEDLRNLVITTRDQYLKVIETSFISD